MALRDRNSGWSDPVKMLLSLRDVIRTIAEGKDNYRVRMDKATYPLIFWKPEDFPERIRNRARMVLGVRDKVAHEYATDTLYHFERLSPKERMAFLGDIIALYEACLLDLGGMRDVEFVYPEDRWPEKKSPRQRKKRI